MIGFIFLNMGVFPHPGYSYTDSGEVPSGWDVWSCWYWPWLDSLNPNLYDAGEAMDLYDAYDVGANAQGWEYYYHGPAQNPEGWWGHCHAWSGASVWEPQPVNSKVLNGIKFWVRDRKGLMVETYDGCADGTNFELYAYRPSPGLFWRYLRDEIRGDDPMHGHGMAFVGELYYGSEVWNYPIFAFEVDYSSTYPYSGTMTISVAADSKPSYADSTTINYTTFNYQFTGVTASGGSPVNSGTWVGSGPYDRPDSIWRPYYATTWMQYVSNTELDESHLSDILSNPKLSVTSPNGGEVIPSGSTSTIEWVAPSNAVNYNVLLSVDGGTVWGRIATGVTDTSCSWEVPKPSGNKKGCLVRVIAFDSEGNRIDSDTSDAPFTIAVVDLTSPDGEEAWTSGTPHTVSWTVNGTKKAVARVKLFYTRNGGSTWVAINTLEGDRRTYSWTIPKVKIAKQKCRVKVVLEDKNGNSLGNDLSDGYFTIEP